MRKILTLSMCLILTGCQAPLATIPARAQQTEKITLGSVQRVLKKGASSSDVIEHLGSPNIVTSNADGTETWVYDKVASEVEYAQGWMQGVATKSTRTMIVVVKLDKSQKIEDIKYRQTSY